MNKTAYFCLVHNTTGAPFPWFSVEMSPSCLRTTAGHGLGEGWPPNSPEFFINKNDFYIFYTFLPIHLEEADEILQF